MSGNDALRVGLCARCAHATVQRGAKSSAFWRCRAADDDPTLLRYPPLPMRVCHAVSEGEPEVRGGDGA